MHTSSPSPVLTAAALALLAAALALFGAGLSGKPFALAGLALGAIAAWQGRQRLRSAFGRQTGRLLLHLGLALGGLGAADALLDRHRARLDLTQTRLHTLSPATRHLLGRLASEAKLTVYFRSSSPGRHLARDLLALYRAESPRVAVEFVDPDLQPSLARRFPRAQQGAIVVASGGRERIVRRPRERDVSQAIYSLTATAGTTVAFAEGSGEPTLTDRGPLGYTLAAESLQHENFVPARVDLARGFAPAGVRLLVMPFARSDLSENAVQAIEAHRSAGGAVLALLEPGEMRPRLKALLESWELQWHAARAYDLDSHLASDTGTAVVAEYPAHPITEGLASTLFPGVTPLGLPADPSKSRWRPICTLSPGSSSTMPSGEAGPAGALVVAAAADGSPGPHGGRVAVIGDSDFLSNSAMVRFPANRELLMALTGWLSEREDSSGPWELTRPDRRLVLTDRHVRALAAIVLLGTPALLLVAAFYFWLESRRS